MQPVETLLENFAGTTPVLLLVYFLARTFRTEVLEAIQALAKSDHGAPGQSARMADEISAFKLEVARGYASQALLHEVDRRVSLQLLRIEEKIDMVAGIRGAPSRVREDVR